MTNVDRRRSLDRPRSAAFRLVAAGIVLAGLAGPAAGGVDFQLVALGNGFPGSVCVEAGLNGTVDSTPAGDDANFPATGPALVILSGANGICETPLAGDDVRPASGITLNHGVPHGGIIIAAGPFGICDDVIVAGGDDVVRVTAGHSEPRMVAISPGPNGTIESTPAGDDLLTAVVCPGPDATFQTVPDPADVLSASSVLCGLCPGSTACIIPGDDGLLQTTVNPADVRVPFISSGADGVAQSTAVGDDDQTVGRGIPVGEGFLDTVCVDAGPDGLAQTTLCGNGVADFEENGIQGDSECDDGNTTPGDGCNALCQREFCGDGLVQAGLGEECDDGNARNDDGCVVGCRLARCGDGFRQRGVEQCDPPDGITCDASCRSITAPGCGNGVLDPGEQCDDGNHSNEDDCLNDCRLAACGDGFVHVRGTPPFEECDDGNVAPGDGCSATCRNECGNGVIDGACSEGLVGSACSTNADCDTAPAAGDGVCVGETCDPGPVLCLPGPQVCSNVCRIAACGNGEVECDEDCDLGPLNNVPGSGCTPTCKRNVVGAREPRNAGECPSAWTLDSAPGDLRKPRQVCSDGASCDFDTIPGQCTFRVGVCLNRDLVPGCTRGGVVTFDLLGVKILDGQQAAAVEALTSAVRELAPAVADVPGRCRAGLRGKVCSIPDDRECDSHFGTGDGICDIGTGVEFSSPLAPADLGGPQVAICTPGIDVVVRSGSSLKLRSSVRRVAGLSRDVDTLRLVCKP